MKEKNVSFTQKKTWNSYFAMEPITLLNRKTPYLSNLMWFDTERLRGGTHEGGSFNITSACIPFLRPGTMTYIGGSSPVAPPGSSRRGTAPPPGKYKIKRKLRLKSNTWQWQRLRICLNSLLIQGKKSFSLLKRILHYTRCTMTESRLNDLALKALHPKRLSELSTEKIIEMFVQANPRKL